MQLEKVRTARMLILGFNPDRNMWMIHVPGQKATLVSDGALMVELDRFRDHEMIGNGRAFAPSMWGRMKQLWEDIKETEVLGYREGQGLVFRDRKTGTVYGRHGALTLEDLRRLGLDQKSGKIEKVRSIG